MIGDKIILYRKRKVFGLKVEKICQSNFWH